MRRFFCIIDAKKTSRSQTVNVFSVCSNFLGKSDKKVKFGKSVRLGLKSMKKGFGRNFDHSRASRDPIKQQQSKKNGVFLRLRVPAAKISLFCPEISVRALWTSSSQQTCFTAIENHTSTACRINFSQKSYIVRKVWIPNFPTTSRVFNKPCHYSMQNKILSKILYLYEKYGSQTFQQYSIFQNLTIRCDVATFEFNVLVLLFFLVIFKNF